MQSEQGTVTSSSGPPEWMMPHMQEALGGQGGAQQLFRNQREYFPGQTWVDFSPQSEQALNQMQGLAGQANAVTGEALGLAQGTARGDYLNTGDAYQSAVDAAIRRATPGIQAQFAGGGGLSNPLAQAAIAQNISDSFLTGTYNQERGRQEAAIQNLPAMMSQRALGPTWLGEVGQSREAMDAAQLQDQIARYTFGQDEPRRAVQEYLGALGMGHAGGYTQSTPYYTNTGANVIGGALGGAQMFAPGQPLANAFPGVSPWLGALGGGILGLF